MRERDVPTRIERIVVFELGDQWYALPVDRVQEIQLIVEPAEVPDTSAGLLGMMDLRGRVIPIIDLRILLGLPVQEYDVQTPMVIARIGEQLAALVVDTVHDVIDVPDDMQSPSGASDLADKMIGICRTEDGLVFVLDIEALLPEADVSPAATVAGGGK